MEEIHPKEYHLQIPHNPNDSTAISRAEKNIHPFEKRIISLHSVLIRQGQLPSLDPVRRAAEEVDGTFGLKQFSTDIPAFLRDRVPKYGERRVLAVETVLCELGLLTRAELNHALGMTAPTQAEAQTPETSSYSPDIDELTYLEPSYSVGDWVQVVAQAKPGHVRMPVYLLGKKGRIVSFRGMFLNPEDVAHFKAKVLRLPLYLVEFDLAEIWGQACPQRSIQDKARIEIYEPWLSQL